MPVGYVGMLGKSLGGGGAFSPSDIAGLRAWYDASDSATITHSGGVITQVDDKSASGYDLTVAAGSPDIGVTTKNSLDVITFAALDGLVHDAGSNVIDLMPWTVFVVANITTVTANNRIFGGLPSGAGTDYSGGSALMVTEGGSSGTISCYANGYGASRAISANTWYLLRTSAPQASGGTWVTAVNGAETTATGPTSGVDLFRYLRVGFNISGAGSIMHLGELVAYNATLASGDITSVENYLTTKWGL